MNGGKTMSRLSEILGVKEGQEFRYSDEVFVYKVEGDMLVSLDGAFKTTDDGVIVYFMIAHPELIHPIPEKPQLSEQQITAIKGRIAEGTPWAARDREGALFFYENKPKLSHDQTYFYSEEYRVLAQFKSDLYDFITFENSPVYLPELVEGSEEE